MSIELILQRKFLFHQQIKNSRASIPGNLILTFAIFHKH
jgi:hypothetical protein